MFDSIESLLKAVDEGEALKDKYPSILEKLREHDLLTVSAVGSLSLGDVERLGLSLGCQGLAKAAIAALCP